MDRVQQETGWPVVAHNRYWSGLTNYSTENGGDYRFIIGIHFQLTNVFTADIRIDIFIDFFPNLLLCRERQQHQSKYCPTSGPSVLDGPIQGLKEMGSGNVRAGLARCAISFNEVSLYIRICTYILTYYHLYI